MRPFLLALSLLLPWALSSQKVRVARTSVYFESNQSKLSTTEKQRLDKLFNKLSEREILGISLKGHTDSDADSLYNIRLSNQRVETVNAYLKKFDIPKAKRNLSHFGENSPHKSNLSEQGKKANRRVEIIVSHKKIVSKEKLEPPLLEEPTEAKEASTDTLIEFKEGTFISINKEEYEEKKDCLEFSESVSLDQIISNGMNTEYEDGRGLNSFGMMQVKVKKKAECDFETFTNPIKVRFPVPDDNGCDFNRRGARPFVLNEDGTWSRAQRSDMKIITVNGRKFYEYQTVTASFGINCDAFIDGVTESTIVFNKGLKPVRLVISSDCPRIVIDSWQKEKAGSVEVSIPSTWTEYHIEGKFVDENNDTVYLNRKPLNSLYTRKMFGGWPGPYLSSENRYWKNGFFTRIKSIYRRYYVLNGDLVMSRSVASK